MMTDVMPRNPEAHPGSASPLPELPTELFIYILDQLTEADNGRRLAFEPSDPITRTLRAHVGFARYVLHSIEVSLLSMYLYTSL
jgi:hypothetical protein